MFFYFLFMRETALEPGTLQEGEVLIGVFQEHWALTLRYIGLYFAGLFLSGMLFWFGWGLYFASPTLGSVAFLCAYLALLVTHHWLFMYLLSLELSGWAITTRRIIDFHFLPYVEHDMRTISILEIKEMEKRQHGILKNLFHYGEVEVNLAANPEALIFRYVAYPGKFVHLLTLVQKQSAQGSFNMEELQAAYREG